MRASRASGTIYTQTLITHYRVYRKHGKRTRHWLSQFAAMRLNDYLTRDDPPLLHAHSKDAAQAGFYQACKTAKANREKGANYPHKRKFYRTTIWKQSAIRRQRDRLLLSRAKGLPPITVELPEHLPDMLRMLEVRLVTQRVPGPAGPPLHLAPHRRERTHFPKAAPGTNSVAVDLGEIHPAVIGDEQQATIVTCLSDGTSSKVTPNGLPN